MPHDLPHPYPSQQLRRQAGELQERLAGGWWDCLRHDKDISSDGDIRVIFHLCLTVKEIGGVLYVDEARNTSSDPNQN